MSRRWPVKDDVTKEQDKLDSIRQELAAYNGRLTTLSPSERRRRGSLIGYLTKIEKVRKMQEANDRADRERWAKWGS
jgi:Na+/phosphate symporter